MRGRGKKACLISIIDWFLLLWKAIIWGSCKKRKNKAFFSEQREQLNEWHQEKSRFSQWKEKTSNSFFVTLKIILSLFSSFFPVPARVIWAAPHRDVELPCDLTPPSLHDSVKLVLWFKDSEGIPMYSLDSRNGGSLKAATHSALAGIRGERVFFSVADNPKDAKLRIKSVEEADGGIYRCRVDYFNSPTRNFRVNLTLVGSYYCFRYSVQFKIQISFSINFLSNYRVPRWAAYLWCTRQRGYICCGTVSWGPRTLSFM